jgi:hypothetical protein
MNSIETVAARPRLAVVHYATGGYPMASVRAVDPNGPVAPAPLFTARGGADGGPAQPRAPLGGAPSRRTHQTAPMPTRSTETR